MFSRECKFELSDRQYTDISQWYERLITEKRSGSHYFGAIGGGVTIEFTPTSIGTFVSAKCMGEELDVSDV